MTDERASPRHLWQTRLLAAVVFLVPWQARWIFSPQTLGGGPSEYLTASVYAVDLLMLAAVAWCRPRVAWREPTRTASPLLALGVLGLSGAVALDPPVALWRLSTVLLVTAFAVTVWQYADRSLTATALMASAVLQSVVAVAQFFAQSIPPSTLLGVAGQLASRAGAAVIDGESGRWLRAYGSWPHPNILGGFLVLGLLFFVDEYFRCYEAFQGWWNAHGAGRGNLWRVPLVRQTARRLAVAVAGFAVVLSGLTLSFSRSAALAAVVATASYVILKFRQNRTRATVLGAKLALVALAVVGLWQLLLPGLWDRRLAAVGELERYSLAERRGGYGEALRVWRSAPLFGTGLGGYVRGLAAVAPRWPASRYQPVHNVVLLAVVELGLVGFPLLLLILRQHLARFGRYLLRAPVLGVATVAALLTVGLLDHYLWSLHAGLVLWPLAALALRRRA